MTFAEQNILVTTVYVAPLVYLGARLFYVHKAWVKTEADIVSQIEAREHLQKIDPNKDFTTDSKNLEDELTKQNKKRGNKILRMGLYFFIFIGIFFWRPL